MELYIFNIITFAQPYKLLLIRSVNPVHAAVYY